MQKQRKNQSRLSRPDSDSQERHEHVICCDINASMLKVGQDRAERLGYLPSHISWREGDAMNLPFDDESFDAYTIAYGIRNVVRIDEVCSTPRALSPDALSPRTLSPRALSRHVNVTF